MTVKPSRLRRGEADIKIALDRTRKSASTMGLSQESLAKICFDKLRFNVAYDESKELPEILHPGFKILYLQKPVPHKEQDKKIHVPMAVVEVNPSQWSPDKRRLLHPGHGERIRQMTIDLCNKVWGSGCWRINWSPTYCEIGVDVMCPINQIIKEGKLLSFASMDVASIAVYQSHRGRGIYFGKRDEEGKRITRNTGFKVYKKPGRDHCRVEVLLGKDSNFRPSDPFDSDQRVIGFTDALSRFSPLGFRGTRKQKFNAIPDGCFKSLILQGEGWMDPATGFDPGENEPF